MIEFGQQGPEIDVVATGERIQELRKALNLRVSDISDYMGFYEPQAVYKWLRGDCLPTLQNIARLSYLFGTTIDDIICYAEMETQAQEIEIKAENAREEGERSSPSSDFTIRKKHEFVNFRNLNRRFIFFIFYLI